MSGAGLLGEEHNYREDVSVWFRSIFLLNPQGGSDGRRPVGVPGSTQLAGMALFIVWPFTRLVHAFSAPVGYVFRPYIVYRDRGEHGVGNRTPRRGWERIG
ncbi:MAG: respiratory nitrate reductase subunit gamma [Candidatus Nanopelagicales bacterium]